MRTGKMRTGILTTVVAGEMTGTARKFDAKVAELVDALVLGTSGATRESSSLSFRTIKLDSHEICSWDWFLDWLLKIDSGIDAESALWKFVLPQKPRSGKHTRFEVFYGNPRVGECVADIDAGLSMKTSSVRLFVPHWH